MRVYLYSYLFSGWIAIDDAVVYWMNGGVPSGGNLAPNPGFESAGGWTEGRMAQFPGASFYHANLARHPGAATGARRPGAAATPTPSATT